MFLCNSITYPMQCFLYNFCNNHCSFVHYCFPEYFNGKYWNAEQFLCDEMTKKKTINIYNHVNNFHLMRYMTFLLCGESHWRLCVPIYKHFLFYLFTIMSFCESFLNFTESGISGIKTKSQKIAQLDKQFRDLRDSIADKVLALYTNSPGLILSINNTCGHLNTIRSDSKV